MRGLYRRPRGSPACRSLSRESLVGAPLKRARFFEKDQGQPPKLRTSWSRPGRALSRALPGYKASSISSQRPKNCCSKGKERQPPSDARSRPALDLFSRNPPGGCPVGPRGRQREPDSILSRRLLWRLRESSGMSVIPNSGWRNAFPVSRRSKQRRGSFVGWLSRHAGNHCLQRCQRNRPQKLFWFLDRFCSGHFGPPARICRRRPSKYRFSPFPIRHFRPAWGAWKNACTGRIASGSRPLSGFPSTSRTELPACLN